MPYDRKDIPAGVQQFQQGDSGEKAEPFCEKTCAQKDDHLSVVPHKLAGSDEKFFNFILIFDKPADDWKCPYMHVPSVEIGKSCIFLMRETSMYAKLE